MRGEALCFSEEGSAFQVGSADYALPMAGELNVRNALAVVAVARHCGLSEIQIQSAFETFQGDQAPHGSSGRGEWHYGD